MTQKLHSYQERGIQLMEERSCMIALDMGWGKTRTVIEFLRKNGLQALVIAPYLVAQSTWPEELKKWHGGSSFAHLAGFGMDLKKNRDVDVLITNYEQIPNLRLEIDYNPKYFKRRVLVLDESARLRNPSGVWYKSVYYFSSLAVRRIELSALPSPQGLMDLWSQYSIIDGGAALGRTVGQYRGKYFTPRREQYGFEYDPKPGAYESVAAAVAHQTLYAPANTDIGIPKPKFHPTMVRLPERVMRLYEKLEEKFLLELPERCNDSLTDDNPITTVVGDSQAALSMKLRQLIQGYVYNAEGTVTKVHETKIEHLFEMVQQLNGKPAIVPFQFRSEIDMAKKYFGKEVPIIAGGVAKAQVAKHLERFKKGHIPVLFCHPASMSHGLNLQEHCHNIIWLGMPWSFELFWQTVGRIYRQGQNHTPNIHIILARGTLDESVYQAVKRKKNNQERFLGLLQQEIAKRRS